MKYKKEPTKNKGIALSPMIGGSAESDSLAMEISLMQKKFEIEKEVLITKIKSLEETIGHKDAIIADLRDLVEKYK